MIFKSFASAFVVLPTLLLLSGCGTSADSFCDQVCACTGCSESERGDCVDTFEDGRKLAEEAGCTDQFDAAVQCSSDELECKDSSASIDGCDAEGNQLADCAGEPIGIGGNACDAGIARIVAKLNQCGFGTGGEEEPPPECTAELAAQVACLEPCYIGSSCDDIVNGSDDFVECAVGCSE